MFGRVYGLNAAGGKGSKGKIRCLGRTSAEVVHNAWLLDSSSVHNNYSSFRDMRVHEICSIDNGQLQREDAFSNPVNN